MIATLTPGAYLKARRTAAALSIADVAGKLATDPRSSEHDRAQQLQLIEADAQPASFATIVALRRFYRFDLTVLEQLQRIAQGESIRPPRLCRICACSERDACNDAPRSVNRAGIGCAWVAEDLCSACAPVGVAVTATEGGVA